MLEQLYINETLQSLQLYAAMLKASKPLTTRELIDITDIASGTLYPLLVRRVEAGLVTKTGPKRSTAYALTSEGYEKALTCLLELEVPVQAWIDTDRRFRPPSN